LFLQTQNFTAAETSSIAAAESSFSKIPIVINCLICFQKAKIFKTAKKNL
jgi:hypothetical protein